VALFDKRPAIRRLVESPADAVAELDGIVGGCRVGAERRKLVRGVNADLRLRVLKNVGSCLSTFAWQKLSGGSKTFLANGGPLHIFAVGTLAGGNSMVLNAGRISC
jgi:hypothetical protein